MKKIIAILGMSGTGKSEAAKILQNTFNLEIFYFGGVVINEVKKRGLQVNNENEKTVREDLRRQFGKGVIAKKAIEHIENQSNSIILDGLYSFTEYKILKEKFPDNFVSIAILSDKHVRYARLKNRDIRPLSKQEVDRRDFTEIENIEKGGPIAIADFNIINNGDMESLKTKLIETIKLIL